MQFRLETRVRTPAWMNLVLPVVAVSITLVICSGLISAAGADVLAAYGALFKGAFGNRSNFIETLVKAAPLIFTGLAVAVAFRAKFWNIGAEGQLLAGAMAAAFIGAREGLPAWSLVPLMIAGGAAAGGVWASLPALLKVRFKVDDVVATLMLNFVMFYGMMALLSGPWKDSLSGYPDSPDIRMDAEFPILLEPTRLHLGVLLAGVGALLVWLLMTRTTFGFAIRAVGENARAAAHGGIPVVLYRDSIRRTCGARRGGGGGGPALPGDGNPLPRLRLHRNRHCHAGAAESNRSDPVGDLFRRHCHRSRDHVSSHRSAGILRGRDSGCVPDMHAGGAFVYSVSSSDTDGGA
jgi:simple sugar transport system permease protein